MFDTMTLTKIVGGICGTFLIFLFGNWAADSIYSMGGGHGEHAQAYVISTGDEEVAQEEVAEVSFDELLASADIVKGEKVFSKCKACHKVDGTNGTGPHLDGVFERTVATVDGFAYSDGMTAHGGAWTPDALNVFLTKPKDVVPGHQNVFCRSAESRRSCQSGCVSSLDIWLIRLDCAA